MRGDDLRDPPGDGRDTIWRISQEVRQLTELLALAVELIDSNIILYYASEANKIKAKYET